MKKERCFGSDPEFFIYNTRKETNYGQLPMIIPPASLIADFGAKFTVAKNNKRILLDKVDYKWIEDGAAIELNYKRPFNNPGDMYNITQSAINELHSFLCGFSSLIKLSNDVLGYFSNIKYWKNRDKSFTDCVRFGCDPDIFPKFYMLAGFEKDTCKIVDASKHNYRYAGGHIHVQNMTDNPDIYFENVELAPIIFDFIVGALNVLFNRDEKILIQEKARLKYYGRPGRIRLQQYSEKENGIEYRPPSNLWVNNMYRIASMFSAADISATIIENNGAPKFFYKFQDRIMDMWTALTSHDKVLSKNILTDALSWALENNYIILKQLEGIYEHI